ncbi:MAG: hypothetical protein ACREQQ_03625 [Candidatus Binatia bacterium]
MQNALVAFIGFLALFAVDAVAGWDPQAFRGEDTLDFLTVGPEEGEHWSRVWLVVLDGRVYVRLGDRAAERMKKNTAAPYVKVRIAGQEFDRVKAEPAPEMVDEVAAAIGEKYWSEIVVRYFSHPLTMRLEPEAEEKR